MKRAQAAGTHVLIAIGGASVNYQTYLDVAGNAVARHQFIQNVVRFVDERGYDGVDLNFEGWFEGLTGAQRDQVNGLMHEVAQAIKHTTAERLVTVPLAPLYWLPMSADCDLINSAWIDMGHHMSYDFDVGSNGANGPWRVPLTQQYLYPGLVVTERSVWGALNYLRSQGCRADKLTAGIPFYSTAKEAWEDLETRHDWRQVPLHPQFLEKSDPQSGVWVTDPGAVAAKVNVYQQLGLAGVIVWQVGHEGTSATLSQALLSATRGHVAGASEHGLPSAPSGAPPRHEFPAAPVEIQANGVMTHLTVRSDWGSGYCADVTVSNPRRVSLAWQVTLAVDDPITTLWDGTYTQEGQQAVVRGAAWNRVLAPGRSTIFGFCATRP
jgi:cellulase/cellobiase CelA1